MEWGVCMERGRRDSPGLGKEHGNAAQPLPAPGMCLVKFRSTENQERFWQQWLKLLHEQSWAIPAGESLPHSRCRGGTDVEKRKR